MTGATPETDALCSDPAIERRDVPARVWREMARIEFERDTLRSRETELVGALTKAADTFRDLVIVLRLLGRPISAQACEIALQGCQEAIAKATESEKQQ